MTSVLTVPVTDVGEATFVAVVWIVRAGNGISYCSAFTNYGTNMVLPACLKRLQSR